ncbi:MAG TPA: GNVR domain-containing protein [Ramlibacter sp.]|uniref:GNVR domain-containing protein n=1 Tax=Ramlibacter sp. TaxID=1917967 RepID=UPI002D2D547A|nr:GNVR domain-containing protein [Ramlibacter sp.]HZY18403.1 GNVR domain-containing protein [Ramlibacter sp.]
MSFERFVEVLRARWKLALAIWLAVVSAAALVSVVAAPQYTATAAMMVEPRTPDPLLGGPIPTGMPNHLPTEIEVVRSERVALSVVGMLKLQDDPRWRARWIARTEGQGSFEHWLAGELVRKLDVRPTRESNVMTVSFTAPRGDTAAQVANAVTQAYIRNAASMQQEPARQYNARFDELSTRLRGELEQAQAKLAAYQRAHGIVSTDDRLDVENTRLAELSSHVAILQAAAADAQERRRQSTTNPDGFGDVQRSPTVFALTNEVARQEQWLTEQLSRRGEQHPDVQEARQALAGLRTRLEAATRRATEGIGIESRMASDRLAQARQALEQQRATLLALRAERNGAQVLQREVDNAQRAYDAVLLRASQTTVEAGAVRATVSILKSATAPLAPSWPRAGLNIAAAAVAGLLLALFAALWRESWNRRLRVAADVTHQLGQSLLVVLPDSGARQHQLALGFQGR